MFTSICRVSADLTYIHYQTLMLNLGFAEFNKKVKGIKKFWSDRFGEFMGNLLR